MMYERKAGRAMLPTPVGGRPAQDLRLVMKMAKPGRKTEAPDLPDPKETGALVIVAGPGVVSCSGLYNLKTKTPPQVKTLYGGKMWVIRPLTPLEWATVYDIPERLNQSLDEGDLEGFVHTAP